VYRVFEAGTGSASSPKGTGLNCFENTRDTDRMPVITSLRQVAAVYDDSSEMESAFSCIN